MNLLDERLSFLHEEIIKMGALCESALENAYISLLENDLSASKKVQKLELEINKKERDIEDLCLKILLRQQPVAKDLRVISGALKLITDLERIGDQARDIAEIALQFNMSQTTPLIKDLAKASIKMVRDCIDCYVSSDVEKCYEVIKYDNIVDELFEKAKFDIVEMVKEDNEKTLEGMYALMVAKYLERISDHATNVCEWVEFSITGLHKGEI